mmetsp:Transcript_99924/g.287168  ORF Transcript_99924/g.287168 Transcript_99924/m.287168 type:complete len:314 (-) Transcript_99924:205-1146(-)
MEPCFAGRYQAERRIGSGAYGNVFAGVDRESGEQVAIKVEPNLTKNPKLLLEAKVCKALTGRPGFPKVRHVCMEAKGNVLIMDLLGPSLEELCTLRGGRLGLDTVLMLGEQLVQRLEILHSLGYVHRDIKPQNVLLGRGPDAGIAHLIDFGLCKRFRDPVTDQHIEYRDRKALVGTMMYASVNALRGAELSRRDDLEAVGYVLLHLLCGSLPWQHLPHLFTKRASYESLLQAKANLSVSQVCADVKEGHSELCEFLTYCKGLGFKECPDYSYLRRLFAEGLERYGYRRDGPFEGFPRGPPSRGLSFESGDSSI